MQGGANASAHGTDLTDGPEHALVENDHGLVNAADRIVQHQLDPVELNAGSLRQLGEKLVGLAELEARGLERGVGFDGKVGGFESEVGDLTAALGQRLLRRVEHRLRLGRQLFELGADGRG